jgi:hypothetical protein
VVNTAGPPMTTALPDGPEGWSTTWAPVLIWRHIAPGRRGRARDVTFKILEGMRAVGGILARARTVCCTAARLVPAAAGGGPGG